ncbi:MAG: Yip1 family protein [Candidatus Palauibacterales bacterium]|nr:Yip1 family protein [Candidatus Palauibacterales bacterium]
MSPSPDDRPPASASSGADRGEGESDLPGLSKRAVQVFVSPGELFDRLRENPVWLDAMLLVVALSVAYTLLIPEDLLREAMMQQAPEGADPEQMEQMTGWMSWFRIVAAVVGPFFGAAVVAGVAHLVFTLVLGGRSTYRQLFSATAHMMLVPTVGTLVTLPLILSTGDVQTTLSLHLLFPALETGTFAFRLLRGLNVFGLAGAGIMGVAVSRLYDNRSPGSAVSVMIVIYVVYVALGAVMGGMAPTPA